MFLMQRNSIDDMQEHNDHVMVTIQDTEVMEFEAGFLEEQADEEHHGSLYEMDRDTEVDDHFDRHLGPDLNWDMHCYHCSILSSLFFEELNPTRRSPMDDAYDLLRHERFFHEQCGAHQYERCEELHRADQFRDLTRWLNNQKNMGEEYLHTCVDGECGV
jgi:hypothetical protein